MLEDINRDLAQLIEYYAINKSQAKSSFRMSVAAIITGFITIISGVWLSYSGNLPNQNPLYISVLAGVILEFIGGAYFYLYNRSLVQLNFFFSRLALMQDTMLAITLTENLPEGPLRHRAVDHLISVIASRDAKILPEPPPTAPRRSRLPARKAATAPGKKKT
ncbi:MAG: hypothetical protein EOR86_17845 [Mesorhizobium sp.]|uniref:TRADD-N-associated membrane domain-containing protein n=1 Tax=Mesorhizobium sp. TaxID=1871066 RepID=UPI000FE6DDC8|nr:hypothetical protein [Mesorhizobium sp.]RWM94050.1 MAG: hypothetical protein EOR86_17845 [Mesorhizobium sp.]